MFQPFYRALGTNVDGSGLGLAIVKEIVDKHGASITIDNARRPGPGAPGEGRGCLFTIRLPLASTALGLLPAP